MTSVWSRDRDTGDTSELPVLIMFLLAHYVSALNLLNLKSNIKQQDLWMVDLNFVKSEQF